MEENKLLAGQKIIVAEDNENSFYLLKYILRALDAEIIRTKTGEETIQAVFDNPDVRLILMDIRMPGMNGLESAMKIREFNNDIKIIAQTATLFQDEKQKVIEAGCNDVVLKPIDKNLLVKKIKEHLQFFI